MCESPMPCAGSAGRPSRFVTERKVASASVERSTSPGFGRVRALLRRLAVQDWVVLVFLVILNLAALAAKATEARAVCRIAAGSMLGLVVLALGLVRGGVLRDRLLAPLLYRLAVVGSVGASYFLLGTLLPILRSRTFDAELHALDLAVFGIEPAVALDAWITPARTEWFAFFYYSYFFLVGGHLFPIVFGCRDQRRLGEFGLGIALCYCVGHVGYMLVPGFGPVRELAGAFHTPLPSGRFTDLVMATVAAGGSQLDIFPSLHTAAPTFISVYSFRHRRALPFRYTWAPMAFFAANIIVATMYLRWHYLIDVVAGLLLGVGAALLAAWAIEWERLRRLALGLPENWILLRSRAPAREPNGRDRDAH